MRGADPIRQASGRSTEQVAEVVNADAEGRVVLACEHACNHIPEHLAGLGLSAEARASHIAWDPGAEAVAREMSRLLRAPLVLSRVSRLVYDCNRAPGAPDAVLARSELHDVPGNEGLSETALCERVRDYYEPFRALLARTLQRSGADATLVTVHSFTPVYLGRPRAVEIGILHDADRRLADLMLAVAGDHNRFDVRRNQPYSPEDGVTHTLHAHGVANGIANVMLEIRSDLIGTADRQRDMAVMLSGWLEAAMASLQTDEAMA